MEHGATVVCCVGKFADWHIRSSGDGGTEENPLVVCKLVIIISWHRCADQRWGWHVCIQRCYGTYWKGFQRGYMDALPFLTLARKCTCRPKCFEQERDQESILRQGVHPDRHSRVGKKRWRPLHYSGKYVFVFEGSICAPMYTQQLSARNLVGTHQEFLWKKGTDLTSVNPAAIGNSCQYFAVK